MGIEQLHLCAERLKCAALPGSKQHLGFPLSPKSTWEASHQASLKAFPIAGGPQRTYTSDPLVPVNKGFPKDQPPGCHQVLKAEDKGTKQPGTKPEAAAIVFIASVPTSCGKRGPGSSLSCSQLLRAAVKAGKCYRVFHREPKYQSPTDHEEFVLNPAMPRLATELPAMAKGLCRSSPTECEGALPFPRAALTGASLCLSTQQSC